MANFSPNKMRIGCPKNPAASLTLQDKDNSAIREGVYQDIEKSKSCANPTYECSIPRVDGYEFCIRHVLRDGRGNFRQCSYVYNINNRKCMNAVPKHDLKKDPTMTTYCFEHTRQVQLQKTRLKMGKFQRLDTNDALMNSLVHHLNVEEVAEKTTPQLCEQDEEIDVVSPHVAPFVSFDQIQNLETIANTLRKRRRILDYASDSDSEIESPNMLNTSKGYEWNDSEDESIDSQDEEPLKHAGIYTTQEAIRISEAKLTKLQGVYIDQINRLHHTLKDRRRRYLLALRKEREVLCSIHDQLKETPQERHLYDQLKALNCYHRRHGIEAVLYKKYKEKRSRAIEGYGHTKAPTFAKCIYTEGGVKCGDRALPCCKYCRKHILEDKKQTLFKACDIEKSGVVCQEPIPCISDVSSCVLHLVIPSKTHYVQKKNESDTEDEDVSAIQMDDKPQSLTCFSTTSSNNQTKTVSSSPSINVTIAHDSKTLNESKSKILNV